MTQVLITDQFDFETLKWFEQQKGFRIHHSYEHQPEFDNSEIRALIVRSTTAINGALLDRYPNLQLVVTTTSGFDHIDLKACKDRGVIAAYTPDANAAAAAEMTWALLLACAKKLYAARSQIRDGNWQRQALTGIELDQAHYGIIGLGRVGRRVARVAQAFGMRISAFDPYQSDEYFESLGVNRLSLEELIKTVDVVSLHVPKSPETQRMFTKSTFEYIRRGIIFINTSRGNVVDEQDLATAIEKGWVGAAGLDVFQKEPLPKHSPLLRSPNIVCTPHIGGRTTAALRKSSFEAANKVIQFFKGDEIGDLLPPKADWLHDTSC